MIIDKITIRNFRSYYLENEFEFKDGLTLIIGDNGDGKTTFFEALEWLFNTAQTEDKTERIVSAKRKKELYDAEKDSVCVTMYFRSDDDNVKIVEKSIDFTRNTDSIIMSNYQFNGYDCIRSERLLRSGKQMLDACFDSYMRRYCLFKGENNLNVFDDDNALQTLVEKFSDIREFDSFVALADYMEETSEKAYKKELSADDKNKNKVKDLEMRQLSVSTKIRDVQSDLKKQEDAASDYQVRIEDLERNQEASEKYQDVKAYISVNKALVTQASAAIPIVPLYFAILYKVMKEQGTHEGCIQQIARLFKDKLLADPVPADEKYQIRMDDWELSDSVQDQVMECWKKVTTENVKEVSDIDGYWEDFYHMFGFHFDNIDYTKDTDIQVEIPSLKSEAE